MRSMDAVCAKYHLALVSGFRYCEDGQRPALSALDRRLRYDVDKYCNHTWRDVTGDAMYFVDCVGNTAPRLLVPQIFITYCTSTKPKYSEIVAFVAAVNHTCLLLKHCAPVPRRRDVYEILYYSALEIAKHGDCEIPRRRVSTGTLLFCVNAALILIYTCLKK
jgi:hypothetical protein